jgi:hypothetical protein
MVISSTVVSWTRQLVVALALVTTLAFLGLEVTLFLLAAAFLY